MLNRLAKLALVSTALAPIFLTLWFVEISSAWQLGVPWLENLAAHWRVGSTYLLAALVLSGLCFGLVWMSASRHGLERLPERPRTLCSLAQIVTHTDPLGAAGTLPPTSKKV